MGQPVVGREIDEFFRRMTLQGWLGHFLAAGVFGVAVPLRQGLDFLDVMFLMAYACLPCLFAAPMVAEAVAGRKVDPPGAGYAAQVGVPYVFASLWNLLILGTALAVVNAANWYGRVVLPPRQVLANVVVLSLCATAFAAGVTGWLSLQAASAKAAKSQARRLFLLILVAVLMYARLAPVAWKSRVESRLTAADITTVLGPVSLVLVGVGLLMLRVGMKRREEEAAGPVFKLS